MSLAVQKELQWWPLPILAHEYNWTAQLFQHKRINAPSPSLSYDTRKEIATEFGFVFPD
jgi:hypothetical protein